MIVLYHLPHYERKMQEAHFELCEESLVQVVSEKSRYDLSARHRLRKYNSYSTTAHRQEKWRLSISYSRHSGSSGTKGLGSTSFGVSGGIGTSSIPT